MSNLKTLVLLSLVAGLTAPVLATDAEQIIAEKKASGAYEQAPSQEILVGRSADCDAASLITCGDIVSGTTVGAPNLVQGAAPDVFFQVLVPLPGTAVFSLCTSGYDSYLYLYNGCPNDGGSLIASNDDFCGLQSQITTNLNAGTYWLVVSGYSSNSGSYNLSVTCQEPVPCAYACDFTVAPEAASHAGSLVANQSVWYCVTGDPALTTISTCNEVTTFDTMLQLWYNSPLGCVQVANDDDDYDCASGSLFTTLGDVDSPFTMEPGGEYFIRVMGYGSNSGNYQLDLNGGTPVVEAQDLPTAFSLSQNVPNPFNPTTSINFTMNVTSDASLKVFDLAGREVATLVSGVVEAGQHTVNFDASNLSSGVYFYTLQANGTVETMKMVLMK